MAASILNPEDITIGRDCIVVWNFEGWAIGLITDEARGILEDKYDLYPLSLVSPYTGRIEAGLAFVSPGIQTTFHGADYKPSAAKYSHLVSSTGLVTGKGQNPIFALKMGHIIHLTSAGVRTYELDNFIANITLPNPAQ